MIFFFFFGSMHQNFDCNKYGSSVSCICLLEYSEKLFNLKFNGTTKGLVTKASSIYMHHEHFQTSREFVRIMQLTLINPSGRCKKLLTLCCILFIWGWGWNIWSKS